MSLRESIAVETTVASEGIMQCLHDTAWLSISNCSENPQKRQRSYKPRKTPEPMHVDDKVSTAGDVATRLTMHVNAGQRLIHEGWL